MKPLLTICIPTFNRADYLRDCLYKLLTWAPVDWEILVGDNASTDKTAWAFDGLKGVKVIHRLENIGAEANLFDLYARAEGAYVTYLADDDELDPDAFQAALRTLQSSDALALYAPWACVDKVLGTSKPFYALPDPLPPTPLGVFKAICLNDILPEIGIFRKEAAVKAFSMSPFAYWAFKAYADLRKEGRVLLSSKPFYKNILRHFEGEQRETLGSRQCITHLGEYRGGLEYLLAQCLEEEGLTNDPRAVRDGHLQISSFMSGRVEVAARLSGDAVLKKRLVSFGS